ncbi:MAG: Uncharacterised protein [Flavobacteriia bacterium]|nr:MAG: Uncharacterised protein [Flavobacteriia bacterium]
MHRFFHQGNKETALTHIVCRSYHTLLDQCPDHLLIGELLFQIEVGNRRRLDSVNVHEVLRGGNVIVTFADQIDEISFLLEGNARYVFLVFHNSDHANGRRGENRFCAFLEDCLVVEAHIAAGDRGLEPLTSRAHTLDGAHELPIDLWIVRIAEVQAVGDGRWNSPTAADVPSSLGDSDHGANLRIGMHVARIAVYANGQGAICPFDVHYGRICLAVGAHIDRSHHGVVLLVDPLLGCDVGKGHHSAAHLLKILGHRHRGDIELLIFLVVCRGVEFSVIDWGASSEHQTFSRNLSDEFTMPEILDLSIVLHLADRNTMNVPLVENGLDFLFFSLLDHGQHPFLRLAQKDLPGLHIGLPHRHLVQMDLHSHSACSTHL